MVTPKTKIKVSRSLIPCCVSVLSFLSLFFSSFSLRSCQLAHSCLPLSMPSYLGACSPVCVALPLKFLAGRASTTIEEPPKTVLSLCLRVFGGVYHAASTSPVVEGSPKSGAVGSAHAGEQPGDPLSSPVPCGLGSLVPSSGGPSLSRRPVRGQSVRNALFVVLRF